MTFHKLCVYMIFFQSADLSIMLAQTEEVCGGSTFVSLLIFNFLYLPRSLALAVYL